MHSEKNWTGLQDDLRDRVLERLGFSHFPTPNLECLEALYCAWCARIPFDNVRKMIALRAKESRSLPGGQSREFFENWLSFGAGGTCWPTSNGLFELLCSLGFEAQRITGCMRDLGIINHASVKVRIDDLDWLVDSSLLTNVPLPLSHNVFIHTDPVFAVEVEPDERTHVIWSNTPPNSTYLPCRLLANPADHACYLEKYERSRNQSPFNQRLYARRNRPGELLVLVGNTRFSRTARGLESSNLSPSRLLKNSSLQRILSCDCIFEVENGCFRTFHSVFFPAGRAFSGSSRVGTLVSRCFNTLRLAGF